MLSYIMPFFGSLIGVVTNLEPADFHYDLMVNCNKMIDLYGFENVDHLCGLDFTRLLHGYTWSLTSYVY